MCVGVDDRKGHAVDRDRPLLDHEAQEVRRRPDAHDARVVALLDRLDAPGRVHVTLDEVPTEAVAHSQRELEVHSVPLLQAAERAAYQRLLHHVGLEAVAVDLDGGETDAVDGDRVAALQLRCKRRADGQARAGLRHLTLLFDEPGEHHHSLSRAVTRTSSSIRSTVVWTARAASAIVSTPSPSTAGRAWRPPAMTGAMKTRSSSTASASRNAPARCGPPSTSNCCTSRAPSSSSPACTRADSFSPLAVMTSIPADSSACTCVREAAREQIRITGVSAAD